MGVRRNSIGASIYWYYTYWDNRPNFLISDFSWKVSEPTSEVAQRTYIYNSNATNNVLEGAVFHVLRDDLNVGA